MIFNEKTIVLKNGKTAILKSPEPGDEQKCLITLSVLAERPIFGALPGRIGWGVGMKNSASE